LLFVCCNNVLGLGLLIYHEYLLVFLYGWIVLF